LNFLKAVAVRPPRPNRPTLNRSPAKVVQHAPSCCGFDVLGLAYKGQRGACASSCLGISEGPGGGAVTIVDARNPGSWPRHPAEELASKLVDSFPGILAGASA
jgi:hypothetical protein